MKIRAVLLDMGGVLLDLSAGNGLPHGQLDFRGREVLLRRLGARRRSSLDILERTLFEPWRVEYRRRYRTGREASWSPYLSRLKQELGSQANDLDLLGAWFGPFADQCRVIPGAPEAVRSLAASGVALGLVSNVPLPGVLYLQILERYDMGGSFDTFHFSYDSGHRKPSPFMLRQAMAELGVSAAEVVMVGDRRESDIAAGRAAGVGTVWIESEHANGPQADRSITSINQLVALLEELG